MSVSTITRISACCARRAARSRPGWRPGRERASRPASHPECRGAAGRGRTPPPRATAARETEPAPRHREQPKHAQATVIDDEPEELAPDGAEPAHEATLAS